jgi:hypothetical protein
MGHRQHHSEHVEIVRRSLGDSKHHIEFARPQLRGWRELPECWPAGEPTACRPRIIHHSILNTAPLPSSREIAVFRYRSRTSTWWLGKATICFCYCCCCDGRRRLNAGLLSITQPTRYFSRAKTRTTQPRGACHHSVVASWHSHKSTSTRMSFNLDAEIELLPHAARRQGLERTLALHSHHLSEARCSALRALRMLLCCRH